MVYLLNLTRELASLFACIRFQTFVLYVARILRHIPEVFVEKSLLPIDRKFLSDTYFEVMGTKILVPGKCFSGAREIYSRAVYFPDDKFFLKDTDVAVDLGSNAGLFTVLCSKICKRVVSIEAQSEFLPEIQMLLKMNSCPENVELICGVVGSSCGVIAIPGITERLSHFRSLPIQIDMGELLVKKEMPRVDFLKIDIEGSEFAIITQKATWLNKIQRIAMEVHPEFGDPWKLSKILRSFGFETRLTSARGSILTNGKSVSSVGGYLFAWR